MGAAARRALGPRGLAVHPRPRRRAGQAAAVLSPQCVGAAAILICGNKNKREDVVGAAVEAEARSAGTIEVVMPYVVPGERSIFWPGMREDSYWPVEEHGCASTTRAPRPDGLRWRPPGSPLVQRPDRGEGLQRRRRGQGCLLSRDRGAGEGAHRRPQGVLVFGDIVRSDAKGVPDSRLPARGAHVDYDEATVRMWTGMLAGEDEAARLLKGRFMLMNLWRPITRWRRLRWRSATPRPSPGTTSIPARSAAG